MTFFAGVSLDLAKTGDCAGLWRKDRRHSGVKRRSEQTVPVFSRSVFGTLFFRFKRKCGVLVAACRGKE